MYTSNGYEVILAVTFSQDDIKSNLQNLKTLADLFYMIMRNH